MFLKKNKQKNKAFNIIFQIILCEETQLSCAPRLCSNCGHPDLRQGQTQTLLNISFFM